MRFEFHSLASWEGRIGEGNVPAGATVVEFDPQLAFPESEFPAEAYFQGNRWSPLVPMRPTSPPPRITLEISDAVVSPQGSVFSKAGEFLLGNANEGFQSPSTRVSGPVVYGMHHHKAFGHWLLHRLPQIYLGRKVIADARVLLDSNPTFAPELLGLIGVAPEEILVLEPGELGYLHIERLVVSSPAAQEDNGTKRIDSRIFDAIRDEILGGPVNLGALGPRIYLSRRGDKNQRSGCVNRRVLEREAENSGFEIVVLENLTLSEQLSIAARTRVVVSELGSQSSWVCFSSDVQSIGVMGPTLPSLNSLRGSFHHPWSRGFALARGALFLGGRVERSGDKARWFAASKAAAGFFSGALLASLR